MSINKQQKKKNGKNPVENAAIDQCRLCLSRKGSPFAKLCSADLREVDRIRTLVRFKAGALLPDKFDGDSGFYCLRSGYVKEALPVVFSGKTMRTVRIAGPGEILNFGAWLGLGKHSLVAVEDGEACFFEREKFREIQDRSPEVANGVIETLCGIISRRDARIAVLENNNARSRAAGLLLSLVEKFGEDADGGQLIVVRLDRRTMATLAGVVPETLARLLTEFEGRGIIAREGRRLLICNKKELQKLAEE